MKNLRWISLKLLAGAWIFAMLVAASVQASPEPSDAAWYDVKAFWREAPATYKGMFYTSQYLIMRDGVRIAIDLYLPQGLGETETIPTILHQTRYHRSMQLRWPFSALLGGKPLDHTTLYGKRRKTFVTRGYAWVDVDVRGSGASEGFRLCPWSPDEIRDGGQIVQWIADQPWSNGRVGAMGISYDGTAAEFLLVNKHPAVRAVAPRFSLFDVYPDMPYPGGVRADRFTDTWQRFNDALDRNAPWEIAGWWSQFFITGVSPVQGDRHGAWRDAAVKDHEKNFNVHLESQGLPFRDDISPNDPRTRGPVSTNLLAGESAEVHGSMDVFSPHAYAKDLAGSGAAIYSYSGWLDGAYPHSAIKRFGTVHTPGSRLILGPWNHGGGWNADPRTGPTATDFDHEAELFRFFDAHLRGIDRGIGQEKPVHYFTMVQQRWKAAETWPPPGARSTPLYLDDAGALSWDKPQTDGGLDAYRVDVTASTGEDNRWRTQVKVDAPVRYPDRAKQDEKLLVYTSAPLEKNMEVTGHPIVTLYLRSSADDGHVIVYLEDVGPNGQVSYVTEGQLRLIHRKLSDEAPPYALSVPYRTFAREDAAPLAPGEVAMLVFDLQPTSYLYEKGHAVRIAVAGADSSQFAQWPQTPPTLEVLRDLQHPSGIDLPVMPGS